MDRNEVQTKAVQLLKVGTYINVAPRVGKSKIILDYFSKAF
jgi:hypothetical protein